MKKNKLVSVVHYNKKLPLKQLNIVVGSLPDDYPHMSEQRKYLLEKQLTRDHNAIVNKQSNYLMLDWKCQTDQMAMSNWMTGAR